MALNTYQGLGVCPVFILSRILLSDNYKPYTVHELYAANNNDKKVCVFFFFFLINAWSAANGKSVKTVSEDGRFSNKASICDSNIVCRECRKPGTNGEIRPAPCLLLSLRFQTMPSRRVYPWTSPQTPIYPLRHLFCWTSSKALTSGTRTLRLVMQLQQRCRKS